MGVVDHDVVEISNLQRQILHTESRVNMPKALSVEIALKEYVSLLATIKFLVVNIRYLGSIQI